MSKGTERSAGAKAVMQIVERDMPVEEKVRALEEIRDLALLWLKRVENPL